MNSLQSLAVRGGCLRSVEIVHVDGNADGNGNANGNGDGNSNGDSQRCPHCGDVIDSQVDASEFRTRLAEGRLQEERSLPSAEESEDDWAATWSRGRSARWGGSAPRATG